MSDKEEQEGIKTSAAERRRQRKAQQIVEKKAQKAQAGDVSKPSEASKSADVVVVPDEEELNPAKYFENRCKMLNEAHTLRHVEIYPHKWNLTRTLPNYLATYNSLEDGEQKTDITENVAGRIFRVAGSGKGLVFYDIIADGAKIQVMASAKHHDISTGAFADVHGLLRRGDVVGVRGYPGKSKRGELSIFPAEVKLLSPCLHMIPGTHQTIKDQEIRCRRRYLDLLVNSRSKNTFYTRAKIVKHIRTFLENDGFVEVETPMMNLIPGGANARPFVTHHNELDTKFFMRIAPELYLKMLVVGGMDKVFEIGKNFRNEGIDMTHNPEFTGCEFYEAYADVYDLIAKTESMLHSMAVEVTGSAKINFTLPSESDTEDEPGTGKVVELDFTPPFKRVCMVDEIERVSGVKLPRPFSSDECIAVMKQLVIDTKLEMPHPSTPGKLLDKLCGHFVEDAIISPTFVIEHPQLMSPLAKWHRSKPDVTERGELFIAGKEICNFYTELNDPRRQRECFVDQTKAKSAGDDEGMEVDEEYCIALEHGLPPTGGWGIGIDRLTMFFTDHATIKDVILFPALRPRAVTQQLQQLSEVVGGGSNIQQAPGSAAAAIQAVH
eukprot:Lankesteria_metandrocarpae@DN4254_c0_g1_i1.p1